MDYDGEEKPPKLPSNLLNLDADARKVTDADEEVFILYTLYPAPAGRTGLGQVDSHHDALSIRFDLEDEEMPEVESVAAGQEASHLKSSSSKGGSKAILKRSKGKGKASSNSFPSTSSRVEVVVHQDSTSLRSTGGDTGSVVWRSSVRLAACLTRQLHKPPFGERRPLLHADALSGANVLELGSGTGVLPAVMLPLLSRVVRRVNWVATDQEAMLPLLRKNMAQLAAGDEGPSVAELDWVHCAEMLRSGSSYGGGIEAMKQRVMDTFPASSSGSAPSSVDLIVAVDCVFNPSLFSPLIDTLNIFTEPDKTLVLVVIELRSSEATMAFIETWLQDGGGDWEIWAVPNEQLSCGLDKGYVAWIGWKNAGFHHSEQ